MAVNSNRGMVFSALSKRYSRDATIEELLREVFSVRSVLRLYNDEQVLLRESLETAVRKVGVSCETVAGQ
jgi:hypothetical protein